MGSLDDFLSQTVDSPDKWLMLFIFLVFGPPAILSKGAAEKLAGLGAPARAFQRWKARRAAAEVDAAKKHFLDLSTKIELMQKEIAGLEALVYELSSRQSQLHGYALYAQEHMQALEHWAATSGVELPPPPFVSFLDWKERK